MTTFYLKKGLYNYSIIYKWLKIRILSNYFATSFQSKIKFFFKLFFFKFIIVILPIVLHLTESKIIHLSFLIFKIFTK